VRPQRAAHRRAHRERGDREREGEDHDVGAERIAGVCGRVAENARREQAREAGESADDEQGAREP
jgi:hypothetical protein